MTQTTFNLIQDLKQAGEDHEFYPTTDEIIQRVVRDITGGGDYRRGFNSLLDIGAGNGKVLLALRAQAGLSELYAIEKSPILCRQLPDDVLIVGTVFEEQSLFSKQVDVIFCNPPYSQFEDWAEKIIREAGCKVAYLVIPERWQKSDKIKEAKRYRDATIRTLGNFSFEDSEDRAARANVQLLKVEFSGKEDDAFERFFKAQFGDLIAKYDAEKKPDDKYSEEKQPFRGLVVGPNYPEALVAVYQQELAKIQRNYELVNQLDVDLLKEFDVSPARIMECLKKRLEGLRHEYWKELFSRLDTVTNRLTAASRRKLLATLNKHVQVDFTVSNIIEILLWVIKNANRYIDAQLIETYELMVAKCNVQMYKSNKRVWEDEKWRYTKDEPSKNSHYALDYRMVVDKVGGISSRYSWDKDELDERARDFLGDLVTLAHNLGFTSYDGFRDRLFYRQKWTPGSLENFYYSKNGEAEELFDVRAFKNGNLHIRLNKAFILALNVEHGRLKGWINTPKEAVEELQDEKAAQYFGFNRQIATVDPRPLLQAAS